MRRVLFLLLLTVPLFGKTLHWRAVDVDARLDRDGRLHITERQQMVFDGDWNGGERDFSVRPRQSLEVHRITRVENGKEIPLTPGDLEEVDQWSRNGDTIRWRSRKPDDPPFASRELTYVIEATYSGVLADRADPRRFGFAHDFGFAQRDGVIERFTLRLTFDPIWGNHPPVALEQRNLPPGEGALVQQELTYQGATEPAAFERPMARWIPLAALALFACGAAFLYWRFFEAERATGRLDPLQMTVDDTLLELKPEVAGAVWDATVGANEVSAVLARMTQEGKLQSRVHDDVLHLTLKADKRSLPGFERELVKLLFYDGRNTTDTDSIRVHYRKTGLDLTEPIREPIEQQLEKLTGWNTLVPRFSVWLDATLLTVAGLLTIACAFISEADLIMAILGLFIGGFFGAFACVAAHHSSKDVTSIAPAVALPSLVFALALGPLFFGALAARATGLHWQVLFALALWMLALLKLMLDLLKIRDTRAKIAYRKRIAGARQFFIEQLEQPHPQLRDEWYPYALAFDLGKHADKWFRAYGAATATSDTPGAFSGGSWSPSGGSGWSGGGGAFGGAGASGTWAVAAGSIASGVSAAGTSTGGGGGGGSSFSGGGGGGGW